MYPTIGEMVEKYLCLHYTIFFGKNNRIWKIRWNFFGLYWAPFALVRRILLSRTKKVISYSRKETYDLCSDRCFCRGDVCPYGITMLFVIV